MNRRFDLALVFACVLLCAPSVSAQADEVMAPPPREDSGGKFGKPGRGGFDRNGAGFRRTRKLRRPIYGTYLERDGDKTYVVWKLGDRSESIEKIAVLMKHGRATASTIPRFIESLENGAELTGGWTLVALRPREEGRVLVELPGPEPDYSIALAGLTGEGERQRRVAYAQLRRLGKAPGLRSPSITVSGRSVALSWKKTHPGKAVVVRRTGDKGQPLSGSLVKDLGADELDGWVVVPGDTSQSTLTDKEPGSGDVHYALMMVSPVRTAPAVTKQSIVEFVRFDPVRIRLASAPTQVAAKPVDNDDGSHLDVSFSGIAREGTEFVVLRSYDKGAPAPTPAKGGWGTAWEVAAGEMTIEEQPAETVQVTMRDAVKKPARYVAVAVVRGEDGKVIEFAASKPSEFAAPVAGWFNSKRWLTAALVLLMALALAYYLPVVRKAPEKIYIRRIPGVDAIEEAVGRSTEMGRPVLYVTGIEEIQDIQTIASLLTLGPVAEMTAEYDTELKVANFFPLTMVVAEEIVRSSYTNAGRADAHKPENVMFISAEQFAFAAGVNGIILRDKPATNIYLGRFFAESLILAETGYVTKAIQIAGTAEVTQLPFFIAACDYTIIGEELYAVSAYLSREPNQLATLKATDLVKAAIIVLIFAGALMATFGGTNIGSFLAP